MVSKFFEFHIIFQFLFRINVRRKFHDYQHPFHSLSAMPFLRIILVYRRVFPRELFICFSRFEFLKIGGKRWNYLRVGNCVCLMKKKVYSTFTIFPATLINLIDRHLVGVFFFQNQFTYEFNMVSMLL